MSDLDQLFKQIPIDDIAKKLGVDAGTAQQGVAAALPALLHGLDANAKDEAGAASILKALESKDTSLIDGGISLADVDTKDGKKIVKHIFGDSTKDVTAKLGGITSGGKSLITKLLPILAPIVLAFLASKIGGSSSSNKKVTKKSSSGGGLTDILGSVLGGASGGSGGGGIGDILGSVLGGAMGGSSGGSGGGIGDILGGLLGGGSK